LVVDHKGIYSIESYLIARRLMYWQVYLHKTAVACEAMLINVLRRAKQLTRQGRRLFATPALTYFLENDVDQERFRQDAEALHHYCALDDNDIWSSVKVWMNDEDRVLALLSANLVERNIFRVKVYDEPIPEEKINAVRQEIQTRLNLSDDECRYLLSANTVRKNMYSMNDDHISIKYKDGTCKDISEASELFDIARISKKNSKYYLCFQRI